MSGGLGFRVGQQKGSNEHRACDLDGPTPLRPEMVMRLELCCATDLVDRSSLNSPF